MKKTRQKVYKNMLDVYIRGLKKGMKEQNLVCNIEVKQHGTKEDCVWVILD